MLRIIISVLVSAFRFILILLFLELAWRYIKRLLGASSQKNSNRASRPSDESSQAVKTGLMVRDPICGMHIVQQLAIKEMNHGNPLFFCSEECRQKYLKTSSQ